MNLDQLLADPIGLLNQNQGVLTLALFVVTLLLGWLSGAFKALTRKPKLKIRLLEGPSFYSVFGTGTEYRGQEVHRTCVALYLRISNVGMSSTTIEKIRVGYRCNVSRYIFVDWLIHRLRWFYLEDQCVVLDDFRVLFGKNQNEKVYPSLFQRSFTSGEVAKTFIESGASTNGVIYFEGEKCWGARFPRARRLQSRMRVVVSDTFGRRYRQIVSLPFLKLAEARRFNPKFGTTRAEFDDKEIQVDLHIDRDGNVLLPVRRAKEKENK